MLPAPVPLANSISATSSGFNQRTPGAFFGAPTPVKGHCSVVLVAMLDEQPSVAIFPRALPEPHEHPTALQTVAVQRALEMEM
jgi:hypothetical protein